MKRLVILCVLAISLAGVSEARAAWLFVNGFQYSDPAFETSIDVDFSDRPEVTGVRAVSASGTALTLDEYVLHQFAATLGPFSSFNDFRNAMVGNWQLIVEIGAGQEAGYNFVVNDFRTPFTASSFPPAPTVVSPPNGATDVAATPTFVWDNGGPHTGAIESLFVSVSSRVIPGVGVFDSYSGGPSTLDRTTWTPPIVLPDGLASFLVQYETNENEDANVGTPVFNPGLSNISDPGIDWSNSSGDLFSRDLIDFTVVPEPHTVTLLAFGGVCLLACAWRRRKRA